MIITNKEKLMQIGTIGSQYKSKNRSKIIFSNDLDGVMTNHTLYASLPTIGKDENNILTVKVRDTWDNSVINFLDDNTPGFDVTIQQIGPDEFTIASSYLYKNCNIIETNYGEFDLTAGGKPNIITLTIEYTDLIR
jgi:hypothetical protein